VELGDVAFIPTDVDLVVDAGLRRHVRRFANDEAYFRKVFVRAYQKLVETTARTSIRY
jgi:L-ascorbate peroxidase